MHPLDGIRAKTDRAGEHLDALDQAVRDFQRENPYRGLREKMGSTGLYITGFDGKVPSPPLLINVLVGDFAHNLRSALDHLAWQLALLDSPQPNPNTSFPIFPTLSGGFERMLQKLPPAARDDIERLQPYQRGDDYRSDPLWVLHEIWNTDKHRVLVAVGHQWAHGVVDPDGVLIIGQFDHGRLLNFRRVAQPGDVGTSELESEFVPQIAINITFGMEGAVETTGVDQLRVIHHYVCGDALPRFERFFT